MIALAIAIAIAIAIGIRLRLRLLRHRRLTGQFRPSTLRRRQCDHLAPPPPCPFKMKARGKHRSPGRAGADPECAGNTAHRGVPGTPLCRYDLPATRPAPHNGAAGQPSRQSVPVRLFQLRSRPPACYRRVRSSSIDLRATAPMVRRWVAEGGPEGRFR